MCLFCSKETLISAGLKLETWTSSDWMLKLLLQWHESTRRNWIPTFSRQELSTKRMYWFGFKSSFQSRKEEEVPHTGPCGGSSDLQTCCFNEYWIKLTFLCDSLILEMRVYFFCTQHQFAFISGAVISRLRNTPIHNSPCLIASALEPTIFPFLNHTFFISKRFNRHVSVFATLLLILHSSPLKLAS